MGKENTLVLDFNILVHSLITMSFKKSAVQDFKAETVDVDLTR